MSQLHPIIAQALAPWTPRTEEEEARWIAADLENDRRKNDLQRVADEIMRRDRNDVARRDREAFGRNQS